MGHVHGGSQGPFLLESRMRFPSGFESALGVDRLAMLAIVETRVVHLLARTMLAIASVPSPPAAREVEGNLHRLSSFLRSHRHAITKEDPSQLGVASLVDALDREAARAEAADP